MNKSIKIALSVAISHFIITSLVGHYIDIQIGTKMGQVVAGGLTAASDRNNKEEAIQIYQDMKEHSDEIFAKWQIPELIISLPAKALIKPLLKDVRHNQMNKVCLKEIKRDQFRTQGLLIDYTANLINSSALGLLIYLILRITTRKIN